MKGSESDLSQIGGALQELRLLAADAPRVPEGLIALALYEALKLLTKHRGAFDDLRRRLLAEKRVDHPSLQSDWSESDDSRLLEALRAAANAA